MFLVPINLTKFVLLEFFLFIGMEQVIIQKRSSFSVSSSDNLGNAYLTSFFVGGAWDHSQLHHSVKAYQNAVRHLILLFILW
jgi:hypothetical protein